MNAFKKIFSVIVLASAIPITTQAYETSGNITLATDYKFRGISQNEHHQLSKVDSILLLIMVFMSEFGVLMLILN